MCARLSCMHQELSHGEARLVERDGCTSSSANVFFAFSPLAVSPHRRARRIDRNFIRGLFTRITDKKHSCLRSPPLIRSLNARYFGRSSGMPKRGIMKKQHLHHIAEATLAGLFMPVALFAQQRTPSFLQAPAHNKPALAKLSKDALKANPLQVVPVIVQFKTANLLEQQNAMTLVHGIMTKHFHATKSVAA